MKIILCAIASLCLSIYSYSQSSVDDVFKQDSTRHIPDGANTITVKNVSFLEVCNAVLDAGLVIDRKDNDLQTFNTRYNKLDPSEPVVFGRVSNGTLILRSEFCTGAFGCMPSLYKEKRNGNPVKDGRTYGFMIAYKIASNLKKDITFSQDRYSTEF